MRRVVQVLPYVSRSLAVLAVLAGIGVGLFQATFGSAFVCFDSFPTREDLFSYLGPSTVQLLLPCVVLELLALVLRLQPVHQQVLALLGPAYTALYKSTN